MLKIAICDDEKYYRDKLKDMSETYLARKNIVCEVELFGSGAGLLEDKDKLLTYDMIFLDVNMNDIDGIETAKRIRQYSSEVFIIFVTAYVSYSPEGYKVNAIRYLLKGDAGFAVAFAECMSTVLERLSDRRLSLKLDFQEGTMELPLENIVFIESNLHKLTVHTIKNGKEYAYTMYERLDTIDEMITSDKFVRIHKSYLVNLKYVADFTKSEVVLESGHTLNVSKARRKEAGNRYILYKGVI